MQIDTSLHIGTLDHMTHVDNLDTILEHGLFSHNNPYKKIDISNVEVNNRRNKTEHVFHKNLHNYVPFYFNPRNAMMYKNRYEDIVILGFSKKLLFLQNALFTNKNAAADDAIFHHDINKLSTLKWNYVWSDTWSSLPNAYEVKQTMMAEALVYSRVDIRSLVGMYVKDASMQKFLIQKHNIPAANIKISPKLFFA